MDADPSERERSVELLNAVHAFPGPFLFRVVVNPGIEDALVAAMCDVVSHEEPLVERSEQASRKGTYLSVRVTLTVARAEEVLDVYAAIRTIEGVVTVI